MSTFVFVLDVDETLLYFNEKTSTVLLRPNCEMFLKKLYELGILILFSMGNREYLKNLMGVFSRDSYEFTMILTRTDCERSMKKYGKFKHSMFIHEKFEQLDWKKMGYCLVGIDDQSRTNFDDGYDLIFEVEPFTGNNNDVVLCRLLENFLEMRHSEMNQGYV